MAQRQRQRAAHKTLDEGKRKADNGLTYEGAVEVHLHIILTFVFMPDGPPQRTVTNNVPTGHLTEALDGQGRIVGHYLTRYDQRGAAELGALVRTVD